MKTSLTITPKPTGKTCGRRFPFRASRRNMRPEVHEAISKILTGIDNLMYQRVRIRSRGLMDEEMIQETVQRCRIWLWDKSLPRFDAWRKPKVKVSTYLYICADNFIKQELRALLRSRSSTQKLTYIDPQTIRETVLSKDCAMDDRIVAVAEDVMDHPERYLTGTQVRVFKAIIDSPSMLMKDLAVVLGYQRPSSLSMILRRIKERIAEIDVEDHVACQLTPYQQGRSFRRAA